MPIGTYGVGPSGSDLMGSRIVSRSDLTSVLPCSGVSVRRTYRTTP